MFEINVQPTRRAFLTRSGLTLATGLVSGCTASSRNPSRRRRGERSSPEAFKRRLAGPILSLPTTFTADRSVNYDAVHKMVGRARRYGVPVFALTAGNSKYALLSYDEIMRVTQALVEAAGGDGLTIAATGAWPTEQVVDYARFSESVGADAVQILRPKGVDDEDALFQHFQTVAANTRLPIVLHGNYSAALIRRLLVIDAIVAMKEDGALTYYIDRAIEFGDRVEIFSGGAESRYLVGHPYGARAFFATYTGFAPDIPMKFWSAIRAGNIKKAVDITSAYDHPFIKRFTHPFWHATLEYFGVAQRYLRPPFESYTDRQMNDVKAFFDGQRLDPEDYRG